MSKVYQIFFFFSPRHSWCLGGAWSIFQNAVAKHQTKTTDQFRRLLANVWWYEISQDYIRDLFDSMPRRVHAVIQREGKMSKY